MRVSAMLNRGLVFGAEWCGAIRVLFVYVLCFIISFDFAKEDADGK